MTASEVNCDTNENSDRQPPRLHIVGRRNAGKTTLVCELIAAIQDRGFRVATVKHTHHNHELDTPGKDSFRHRQAGAAAVGIRPAADRLPAWPCGVRFDRTIRSAESRASAVACRSRCAPTWCWRLCDASR